MRAITEKVPTRIPRKGMKALPFLFLWCDIETKGGLLLSDQHDYARTLVRLHAEAGLEAFRRLCHKLAWIAVKSPAIHAPGYLIDHVTEKTFAPSDVKLVNNAVSHALNFVESGQSYPRLNPESLHPLNVLRRLAGCK